MCNKHNRPFNYGKLVVIDIETLDTRQRAATMSVGIAVIEFCGKLLYSDEFILSTKVQLNDYARLQSNATIAWWKEPERLEEYQRLQSKGSEQTLYQFELTMQKIANRINIHMEEENATIWGNSNAFDLGNLQSLFEAVEIATPWEYWQEQDYRTLQRVAKNLGFANPHVNNNQHNAESDAIYEARSINARLMYISLYGQ